METLDWELMFPASLSKLRITSSLVRRKRGIERTRERGTEVADRNTWKIFKFELKCWNREILESENANPKILADKYFKATYEEIWSHCSSAGDLNSAWLNDEEVSVDGDQQGGEGGEKNKSGLATKLMKNNLAWENIECKILILTLQGRSKCKSLTCEVPTSLQMIS